MLVMIAIVGALPTALGAPLDPAIAGIALANTNMSETEAWCYVVGWATCGQSYSVRIGDDTTPLDLEGCSATATSASNDRGTFRIPISEDVSKHRAGERIVVVSSTAAESTDGGGFLGFLRDGVFRILDLVLWFIDEIFRFFGLPWRVSSPSSPADSDFTVPVRLSQLIATAGAGNDVVIGRGQTAVWDLELLVAGIVRVEGGSFICPVDTYESTVVEWELQTDGVVVAGSGSKWHCDVSSDATVSWTVTLTGDRQLVYGSDSFGVRAIVAVDGGVLRWAGASGKEGFYFLEQTADVGASTIRLADADGIEDRWEVGDEIVIAPTDFSAHEAETRFIVSVSSGGQISLSDPLEYQHWGSVEGYNNGKGLSWILDERAEVFNLRRNFRIQAESDGLTASLIGGHVMVDSGFAYIDNVEFSQLGQAGISGRYPLHFHLGGDSEGEFVRNCSIHRAFSRCVVIHQTSNLEIERNSCFDHFGHGFFLEDGNEQGNRIIGNIGVLSKRPMEGTDLLVSDIDGDLLRFAPPATFWISHPNNVVLGNVAAGSEGSGFWMAFVDQTRSGVSPRSNPLFTDTLVFDSNRAHSMVVGITHDGAPTGELRGNPRNPNDRYLESAHYDPPNHPVFNDLVAFKCSGAGIYFRGSRASYRRAVVADNGMSLFMAFDQDIEDSLVVGISENSSIESALPRYSGAMVYDGMLLQVVSIVVSHSEGPIFLENIHFARFLDDNSRALDKIGKSSADPFGSSMCPNFACFVRKIAPATIKTGQARGLTFEDVTETIQLLTDGSVWADEMCASLSDIDGSLTGTPGQLAVPDHPWNEDERCSNPGEGTFSTLYCMYEVSYIAVFDISNIEGNDIGFTSNRIRIADGSVVSIGPTSSSSLRNKFSMIQDGGYQYSISGLSNIADQSYKFTYFAKSTGSTSPVVMLEDLPVSCRILHGGTILEALNSLTELEQSNSAATFRDGTILMFRLRTTFNTPKMRGDTFRGQGDYELRC